MLRFNGDVSIWNQNNLFEVDLNTTRIQKYDKIKEIINKNLFNGCKDLNLEAVERIGSDSSMAEVFKFNILNIDTNNVRTNPSYVAVKILPINGKNDDKNELEIAKMVSQLVRDGKSIYFPLVYLERINV
jgi:hypothetical protein